MGNEKIQRLVTAAQSGDADAYRCLMEQHRGMVFRVCYRLTDNPHDAEELAHEAFVEAYIKLRTLREAGKFTPWLRTLTLNLCRGWYRQKKRYVNALWEDALPMEQAANDTTYTRLFAGLGQLSPDHRLALVLHYLEGLSYEETAYFLDVPVGTVMSRLHRARRKLKGQIEKLSDIEEIPMVDEQQFSEEVDAEIALLLRMFQQEPNAMERLSIILKNTPERIKSLLAGAIDESVIESLALLSPRLGAPAMGILLALYYDTDSNTRDNALAVLLKLVANCRSECNGVGTAPMGVGLGDMAGFDAYLLLDQLIQRTEQAQDASGLLIELLQVVDDAPTGQLLGELMLCLGEPANNLLNQRFYAINTMEEVYRRSNWIAQTLRISGPGFLARLTDALKSEFGRIDLTLAGMDMQQQGVRSVEQRAGKPVAPGARFICETRDPALVSLLEQDDDAVREAAAEVSRFLADDDTELRNTAIRVMESLGGDGHTEELRACMNHPVTSTRVAAICALAGLEDHQSADRMMSIAQAGEASERIAAIAALGRLRISDARQQFIEMLEDRDATIVKAAIVALGELGRDEASLHLKPFLSSPDKSLRSSASKALFGTDRKQPDGRPGITKRKPHFPGDQLEDPNARRVHHISADAAVRILPEIRSYTEREITERISLVCGDWASTRRKLIEHRLVSRSGGVYEFTELGSAVWRVEHYIMSRYMRG
jgi:RNA polymerase sigma-70 factor (ECF subfamily)